MDSRETHDFMNVHSFSELPFIRPPPPPSLKDKPLKLFGIEFPNDTPDDSSSSAATNPNTTPDDSKDSAADNAETSRRFECHYCCRNFPTSQALGGHQNAHKRERQHAKRAHLHSAMLHHSLSVDSAAHVYGLVNYPPAAASPYPTWHHNTTSSSTGGRFYGGSTTSYPHVQPINGSPLALWRIPSTLQNNPTTTTTTTSSTAFNRDRSLHLQHHLLPLQAGDGINVGASHHRQVVGSASSQNGLVYDTTSKPGVHDHVSLDLHL